MDGVDMLWVTLFMAVFLFVGIALGIGMSETKWKRGLEPCAKQHNVYACEWLAVPKGNE